MELLHELTQSLIALSCLSLFAFTFFYIPYLDKKKAGRLNPKDSFLKNLWNAILP
jgi:hypothetical protein